MPQQTDPHAHSTMQMKDKPKSAASADVVSPATQRWRRRAVLAGTLALAAAWTVGIRQLASGWPSRLTFRDMSGLAPFRLLETGGPVSTGAILQLGSDLVAADPADVAVAAVVRSDPCAALFGLQVYPRLPIAFFSDFNCPNCRILDATLLAYDSEHPRTIRIVRHELPLLGEASIVASKAVLAADLQGGYTTMQNRLMRARMVTDLTYVAAVAQSAGLDGKRLVEDMQSPKIEAALSKSRATAELFGFYGTPGTVIGRSVFVGAIPAADVAQIIEEELAEPTKACGAG